LSQSFLIFIIDEYKLLASPLPGDTKTDSPTGPKRIRKTHNYGVQWEPVDFLEKAKEVQHPKNPRNSLPDVLKLQSRGKLKSFLMPIRA